MKISGASPAALAAAAAVLLLLSPAPANAAGDEVPWERLAAALSAPSLLTTPTIDALTEQCPPPFTSDPAATPDDGFTALELQAGSHWQLLDQPVGVCMNTLSCVFGDCAYPDEIMGGDPFFGANFSDFIAADTTAAVFAAHEEALNLPDRVVHPKSAADVVAAVVFAGEHGVPVTVKTTGHHYNGGSIRKETLNINTRSLPAYAIDESTEDAPKLLVYECPEAPPADDTSYLGNACRLALARGKTAVLRVGGGEVWDAVHRSVLFYNEDPANADGNKYLALSGNAGSVSAAGGWLASGGNSGSRGSRLYGLGVDQVLQMEMVLPDGTHVRFGPEEWEEAPDFLYPKTTLVRGYCNDNPVADETQWSWTECDVTDFNGLWTAARGGGGGTWGIVLSVVYQLHPRPEGGTRLMKFLALPTDADAWQTILDDANMTRALDEAVEDFKLEFYHNPSAIGVAEKDSNACGSEFPTYPHFSLPPWDATTLFEREMACLGRDAGEAWAGGWKTFVLEGRGRDRLLGAGFTESNLQELAGWAYGEDWIERAAVFMENTGQPLIKNSTKQIIGCDDTSMFEDDRIPCDDDLALLDFIFVQEDLTKQALKTSPVPGQRLLDGPQPYFFALWEYIGLTTTNVAVEVLLQNRDFFVPFLTDANINGDTWYAYGGAIQKGHDQTTSIPANRREAGIYMPMLRQHLEQVLPLIFESGGGDAFPGFS